MHSNFYTPCQVNQLFGIPSSGRFDRLRTRQNSLDVGKSNKSEHGLKHIAIGLGPLMVTIWIQYCIIYIYTHM